MESLPDSAGNARRAWLRATPAELPPQQSDFEKSLAWRVAFAVAAIVVTINVLAPPPAVATARQVHVRV
jgi:hypothetical protein